MTDPLQVPFSSDHFNLDPLAAGIFAAIAADSGAAIANAGILDLGDCTLVYDTCMTPGAAQDLLAAARQVTGREPGIIVNSHYHNDHIWGNQVFSPEAHIISSARTRELIQTEGKEELRSAREDAAGELEEARKKYAASESDGERREMLLWVSYYQALQDCAPDLKVRLPDLAFEESLTIHGSTRTAQLTSFERAHSGHDTVLYLPEQRILFTADLLFVGYHPFLAEGDPVKLVEALHQMSAMDASVLVPGHGPVGTARDIALNIEYVSMCVDIAKRLLGEGDTSWKRIAQEKLPEPFSSWKLSRFFAINIKALAGKLSNP